MIAKPINLRNFVGTVAKEAKGQACYKRPFGILFILVFTSECTVCSVSVSNALV